MSGSSRGRLFLILSYKKEPHTSLLIQVPAEWTGTDRDAPLGGFLFLGSFLKGDSLSQLSHWVCLHFEKLSHREGRMQSLGIPQIIPISGITCKVSEAPKPSSVIKSAHSGGS